MAAPYSLNIDPTVAQQLVQHGGTLLVLGLPEGSLFGIDHMAFTTGPRFQGVKMLPPGPHFACYCVPGSHSSSMSPVTGFFFVVPEPSCGQSDPSTPKRQQHVVVRCYDAQEELLVAMPDDETARYAAGVSRYDFDAGLAPYNLPVWQQWRALTSCLDAQIIDALQPVGCNISIATEAPPATGGPEDDEEEDGAGGDRPKTLAEARLADQLGAGRAAMAARATAAAANGESVPEGQQQQQRHGGDANAARMDVDGPAGPSAAATEEEPSGPSGQHARQHAGDASAGARAAGRGAPAGLSGSSSGRCFYTKLQRLVKRQGLTPAQLTALNMDKSAALEAAAAGRWGGAVSRLVGELQFAFIAFMCGQSLQGFRQWRALLQLFLSCESAPLSPQHAPAFATFTRTLRAQLAIALAPSADTAEGGVWHAAFGAPLVDELLMSGGGRGSFLRHHLAQYLDVLHDARPQLLPELAQEVRALSEQLRASLGWELGSGVEVLGADEDDEDAPIVVEGVDMGQ